jgi:membrane protein implicated in regulation of membrane protease activity
MVGESAILIEPLAVGETGKVVLRGTTWASKNDGTTPLSKGQRGKVTRVDGVAPWIITE